MWKLKGPFWLRCMEVPLERVREDPRWGCVRAAENGIDLASVGELKY